MRLRDELISTHHHRHSTMKVFTYPSSTDTPAGVILAVHGFRGDHHGLARITELLPEYTFIVPDLPGFGASSPMDTEHDVEGYARVLDDLASELQLGGHVILLGHSFGSLVAAKLATLRVFSSLILLNPISEPPLESSQRVIAAGAGLFYEACAKLPAGVGERILRSGLITDAMSWFMTKSRDPQLRRYVRDQHRAYFSGFHNRQTLSQAYRASISHTVQQWAPRIAEPVLMVGGEDDEMGSPDTQEQLRASFPQAVLVMLENVGHLIHYEKPEETAWAIREFLAGRLR
ncbi:MULTISPECIES: alpha/beta fold hydrolase [Glutamicibacter]|uniref:alpha/beta fold hydrolase n=1 Tax=Glutamicibacter TaxID=1742989 RepID=UPI00321643CE